MPLVFKVTHLQRISARKKELSYEFSYKECSEISPKFVSLYFVGEKISCKIPAKFPAEFPCEKLKKNQSTRFCRSAGRTRLRTVEKKSKDIIANKKKELFRRLKFI